MKKALPVLLVALFASVLVFFGRGDEQDVPRGTVGLTAVEATESTGARALPTIDEQISGQLPRQIVESAAEPPALEGESGPEPWPYVEITFEGRAVDAFGAPIFEAKLEVSCSTARSAARELRGRGQVRTDSRGLFRSEVGSVPRQDEASLLALHLRLYRKGELDWVARPLHFEGQLVSPVQLGDVVFELPPMLVQGHVVDARGRAIEGAEVTVSSWVEGRPRRLERQMGNPSGVDGSFQMLAEASIESERLGVRAEAGGYMRGGMRTFVLGESDVELMLERGGEIEGQLVVPEQPLDMVFETAIQPEDPGAWEDFAPKDRDGFVDRIGDWWVGCAEADGGFTWSALPRGSYRVKVMVGEPEFVIGDWSHLVVRAGETMRDPRMQAVDVLSLMPLLDLEVVDREGNSLTEAEYFFVTAGQRSLWPRGVTSWSSIVLREEGADGIVVSAPGFLEEQVAIHSSRLRVVLDPAPEITLTLPAGLDLPALPRLSASLLVPEDEPGEWRYMPGVGEPEFVAGEARFRSAWLGPVRVAIKVAIPSRWRVNWNGVQLEAGDYYIDIGPALEGQRFEVPLSMAAIEAARSGG